MAIRHHALAHARHHGGAIHHGASGMLPNAGGVPAAWQLSAYNVNLDDWEAVRWSLYDSAAYPTTGIASLAYFQTPVGSGTGFGGGAKTNSDTNMTLNGQLPRNQMFLIQSVELDVQTSTPTVAATMPAAFGAQAAATQVNDAYIIRRSGNLTLQIGSKPYLQEAPLMRFPARSVFSIDAALADGTTLAGASQSRIAWGRADGQPYFLSPGDILLPENQNFVLTLSWPEGLQAVTSAARIFARLQGVLYRRAQ